MTFIPTLNDWNWHIVMLSQALLGLVSENVRHVGLEFKDEHWVVHITLSKKCQSDIEEFEDISDDFLTYIDDVSDQISKDAFKKVETLIRVSDKPIQNYNSERYRAIFQRKEEYQMQV